MGKISIKINTKGLRIAERMPTLEQKKIALKDVSTLVINRMTQRIHIRGEKAAGGPIGTYSDKYMKVREKANRTEPKTPVILALTDQLYRSWTTVATDRGYGVGFGGAKRLDEDISNAELVGYLRVRYPGTFILSDEEKTEAVDYIKELYLEAITGKTS